MIIINFDPKDLLSASKEIRDELRKRVGIIKTRNRKKLRAARRHKTMFDRVIRSLDRTYFGPNATFDTFSEQIWHSERAITYLLLGYIKEPGATSWIRLRERRYKPTGKFHEAVVETQDNFITKYLLAISEAEARRVPISIIIWPLAELFEELTNFYPVQRPPLGRREWRSSDLKKLVASDDFFIRVVGLFFAVTGTAGIWAISRAAQEVRERDNAQSSRIDQLVLARMGKSPWKAIYQYCHEANTFEEECDFSGFSEACLPLVENRIIGTEFKTKVDAIVDAVEDEDSLRNTVATITVTKKKCDLGGAKKLLQLIKKNMTVDELWIVVSFYRMLLRKMEKSGTRFAALDYFSMELFIQAFRCGWPMFQTIETFEPIFLTLAMEPEGRFTRLVKGVIASGSTRKGETKASKKTQVRQLELAYGVATCICEYFEGRKYRDLNSARRLVLHLVRCKALENQEHRIIDWFRFRCVYPYFIKTYTQPP